MLDFCLIATLAGAPAPPPAEPEPAPPTVEATDGEAPADGDTPPVDDGAGDDGGVTYYQFSGLGIDGELRTPALLQFLSRIGGEFETVGIPHRSFMPELRQTVMEDAL